MRQIFLVLLLILLPAANPKTFNPFPKKAGDVYRKLPNVKKGGTLYTYMGANPKTLNPYTQNDFETMNVLHYIFARLLEYDFETDEYFPMLAEKLEVSRDWKVMTFTLRKNATWSDGTPITSDDAEFTYKTLMDPKVEASPKRNYFGPFEFEKVDALTFRFKVENPNVQTLRNFLYDFLLIQKKQFANVKDFNRDRAQMEPVVSGPYTVKGFSRDQKIELERRKDWWGYQLPEMKNLYNFDTIIYRVIPDRALVYEKFVKGEIDVMIGDAETLGVRIRGTDKEKVGTSANSGKSLWAAHMRTQTPAQWTYVGWNLKRPLFQSKKTRHALAQLIDYDQIIQKVYYDEGVRSFSPFGSVSPNTDPAQKKKAFQYNPVKALALLKEDGWMDTDQDNVLDKIIDGKKVKFEFLLRYNSENPMRAKVAQMVKESFKKSGITVNVQAMEWNSYYAQISSRDFDAIVMGWAGGSLNAGVTQIWHSKSYENKGSNFGGYSNPEVDKLADLSEKELDRKKRFKIVQKAGAIIYDDQPYAFIVEVPGFIMGVNSRIKSHHWALKYESAPPLWQFYTE